MDISISIPSFELVDGDNGTPLVKFCVSVASKYALWEVCNFLFLYQLPVDKFVCCVGRFVGNI